MAYIEAHQSLRDHRKILALAGELDMPEPHVAGHCLYLWLWSLDNAPEGVLPASERIIERAAGWTGAAGALVAAMERAGMLERDEDGSLRIHDWYDYAGKLMERRKANAKRQQDWRERHATGDSDTPNAHVTVTSPSRNGANVTKRSIEKHNQIVTSEGEGERKEREIAPVAVATTARSHPPTLTLVHSSEPAEPQATAPQKPPQDAPAPPRAASSKSRPVNATWDALVAALGYEPATKAERSKWGKAVKDLNDVGATPQEIALRARRYVTRFTREMLSVTALVSHWGEMATEPAPRPTTRASPDVSEPPTYAVVTDGRFSPWK